MVPSSKRMDKIVTQAENIKLLNHRDGAVAEQIYSIFQASYKVEAELIQAKEFPPLRRSAQDVALSPSKFWGQSDSNGLMGIIEVEQELALLQISSLAIAPRLFRKGIGANLVNYVLSNLDWQTAQVQTATANFPAIALYQKAGFTEQERWQSQEGTELILLSKCHDR